jgi:sterol desaturase/sphingolipid hydroxylase (fatty acid hydroxylase superfamily)
MIFIDNISTYYQYIPFNLTGFGLGIFTYLTGIWLDNTIAKKTKKYLIENDSQLLDKAYKKAAINLLIINPIVYDIVNKYLISHTDLKLGYYAHMVYIIMYTHSYYFLHMAMHEIEFLKPIHEFHHKFKKNLIPSISNAVSIEEYLFVHVIPLLIVSRLLNFTSFILLDTTISLFNFLIHCSELKHLNYGKYLISAKDHVNHHDPDITDDVYSTPLLNVYQLMKDLD